jgi:hypothetical protein
VQRVGVLLSGARARGAVETSVTRLVDALAPGAADRARGAHVRYLPAARSASYTHRHQCAERGVTRVMPSNAAASVLVILVGNAIF